MVFTVSPQKADGIADVEKFCKSRENEDVIYSYVNLSNAFGNRVRISGRDFPLNKKAVQTLMKYNAKGTRIELDFKEGLLPIFCFISVFASSETVISITDEVLPKSYKEDVRAFTEFLRALKTDCELKKKGREIVIKGHASFLGGEAELKGIKDRVFARNIEMAALLAATCGEDKSSFTFDAEGEEKGFLSDFTGALNMLGCKIEIK